MHGTVLGHNENVLALQNVGGGKRVGNLDGHSEDLPEKPAGAEAGADS